MAEEGKQETKAEPRTYHRDRLIAEATGILGVPHYVVEAALSSGRAGQKVNFTVEEAERLVKQYNEHEVEIDHPRVDEEA